jgi:hypothetical protein
MTKNELIQDLKDKIRRILEHERAGDSIDHLSDVLKFINQLNENRCYRVSTYSKNKEILSEDLIRIESFHNNHLTITRLASSDPNADFKKNIVSFDGVVADGKDEEIPVQDFPLFLGWPAISPEFERMLKEFLENRHG